MKKRIAVIIAALALVAAPVIAQEYIPPADAIVFDMGVSDGTNIIPLGTLYCVTAEPRS